MIKILAAIGVASALTLAPVIAFAEDAAPAGAPAAGAPEMKPVHHHHRHHHVAVVHHHHHHHTTKKMEKPAEAPKS
jgi:Spy/CpxP family protein refolding chaperone